jgi:hypothetical protein
LRSATRDERISFATVGSNLAMKPATCFAGDTGEAVFAFGFITISTYAVDFLPAVLSPSETPEPSRV